MKDDVRVLENLTEDEAYLFAILSDPSGIDQAEFLWEDQSSEDNLVIDRETGAKTEKHPSPSGCFRAWAYQVPWWRDDAPLQIDCCARSVGKSIGIQVRACAFPFLHPGQEMVITAPELVHLEPISSLIENRYASTRTLSEMVPTNRSAITHRPFQLNMTNGCRIIGRIPQRDGRGVKGVHPIMLELDEAQDYGHAGWVELQETLKRGWEGAQWRAHGVTRGVRDDFFNRTQDSPDNPWKVHRIPAMARPNWTDQEREEAIKKYGSREDPDYRRNVLGLHGDKTNPIFVTTSLMKNVDVDKLSAYNAREYFRVSAKSEQLELFEQSMTDLLTFPQEHLAYIGDNPERPLAHYWTGMDLGFCVDEETEIFTQRGWLRWDEVEVGDRTLGIDPDRDISEWQEIEYVFRDHRSHIPMIAMEGQSFHALTTPHHRWLVEHVKCRGKDWRWTTSAEMNTKDRVPLAVPCGDLPTEAHYSDEFVELVAWYWTEGCNANTGIALCQSYRSNAEKVARIDRALEKEYGPCGRLLPGPRDARHEAHPYRWSRTERPDMGMVYYYLPKPLAERFWEVAPACVPTPEFLQRLTQAQLDRYIETSVDGDGWRDRHGGLKIEQRREACTRAFEYACGLAGRPTATTDRLTRGRFHTSLLRVDRVGVMRAAGFPRVSNLAMTVETIDYSGTIWCPQVRHRNWLARRDGAVYYTGNTIDPSELLVCVEYREKPEDEQTVLKLLSRISMVRMPHREQMQAILHTIDFYKPRAFAMDKGGVGLSLYQELSEHVEAYRAKDFDRVPAWMQAYDLDTAVTTIRGYHFGEKVLVDIDPSVEVGDYDETKEIVAKAGMRRNAKEFSTDVLRELADNRRLRLPWDDDLLKQFQGGTWTATLGLNQYGKRTFSSGNDHVLDGFRMLALGWRLNQIEEITKEEPSEPVYDSFIVL